MTASSFSATAPVAGAVSCVPDVDAFVAAWLSIAAAVPREIVQTIRVLTLDSRCPPWTAAGLTLRAGDELSWFACGETVLTSLPSIRVSPTLQVWARVGEQAPIFRGVRNSHSFVAARDGALELATYFPGEWTDPQGGLAVPAEAYAGVEGAIAVVVLQWAPGVRAIDGLARLPSAGPLAAFIGSEAQRLREPVLTPAGWSYLWAPGPAEIYHAEDDAHCIACHTRADVGILHHDAGLALTPGTFVEWDWRIDSLPSAVAEDSLPTHDYLSLAVEFDNGRDLSYFWSAEMPIGAHFDCPIPTWTSRETHLVVRSGTQGFEQWQRERRDLHADYQRCMGTPPARIVRVWLIAVSLFQRGEGRCAYRNIVLEARGGARHRVGC